MNSSAQEEAQIQCPQHGKAILQRVNDKKSNHHLLCEECMKNVKYPQESLIDAAQKLQQNVQIEEKGQSYIQEIKEYQQKSINCPCTSQIKYIDQQFDVQNTALSNQQTQQVRRVPIEYKLVNQVKQQEECYAIAFNNADTIMVAGLGGNIKIWEFNEDKVNKLAQLKGLSFEIKCLIFSKIYQWFVSGDRNGNIQLFKQGQSNKEWLESNIQNLHNNDINCMILNSKEDQLISCSYNENIIVWQVDYSSNQLQYSYTLETNRFVHLYRKINQGYWARIIQVNLFQSIQSIGSENQFNSYFTKVLFDFSVYSLSLNESNTCLISNDSSVILWIKGSDDKWQYKNSVRMRQSTARICFISEHEFIVQQWGQGYSNVFKIEDYQLKEQYNSKIHLSHKNMGNDWALFPTIYNKRNDLIIQKSSSFVYIIRREINDKFEVQGYPIDCESPMNFGAMTDNGKNLVIWNNATREFRIYKLNYQ